MTIPLAHVNNVTMSFTLINRDSESRRHLPFIIRFSSVIIRLTLIDSLLFLCRYTFILYLVFFYSHLYLFIYYLFSYIFESYFFNYLITFCSHCLLRKLNFLSFNERFTEKRDIVRHKVNFIKLILY